MAKSPLEERVNESEESRRLFAQEELILDATESIWERMDELNTNKRALAKVLNKSPAFITQILDGSRNMTLRTLSDVAFALDSRVHIELCDAAAHSEWVVTRNQTQREAVRQMPRPELAANSPTAMESITYPVGLILQAA